MPSEGNSRRPVVRDRRSSVIASGLALSAAAVARPARATVLTPTQVRTAYGVSNLSLYGAGQTIAIIDTYDDPTIRTDLATFDSTYGVKDSTYGFDPTSSSSFTVTGVNGAAVPTSTTTGSETALDVEWAHALAPAAKIVLVETTGGLAAAAKYAASIPGVSTVSISYGQAEYSGETSTDSNYLPQAGHAGVTFFASSGDSSNVSYVAASPYVVAVGATNLTLGTNNSYGSETAWGDTAGGVSKYEAVPTYQTTVAAQLAAAAGTAVTGRMTPDVSIVGGSGSSLHTVIDGGYYDSWGTSASAPIWAGIMALADEGRADNGLAPLSTQQALTMLYALVDTPYYALAFNDVTTGTNANGTSAGTGYDELTGLGTPKADWLVPYLAGDIATPEPTALALTALGTTFVLVPRRRRRVANAS
jgi:subtilase family serine protease